MAMSIRPGGNGKRIQERTPDERPPGENDTGVKKAKANPPPDGDMANLAGISRNAITRVTDVPREVWLMLPELTERPTDFTDVLGPLSFVTERQLPALERMEVARVVGDARAADSYEEILPVLDTAVEEGNTVIREQYVFEILRTTHRLHQEEVVTDNQAGHILARLSSIQPSENLRNAIDEFQVALAIRQCNSLEQFGQVLQHRFDSLQPKSRRRLLNNWLSALSQSFGPAGNLNASAADINRLLRACLVQASRLPDRACASIIKELFRSIRSLSAVPGFVPDSPFLETITAALAALDPLPPELKVQTLFLEKDGHTEDDRVSAVLRDYLLVLPPQERSATHEALTRMLGGASLTPGNATALAALASWLSLLPPEEIPRRIEGMLTRARQFPPGTPGMHAIFAGLTFASLENTLSDETKAALFARIANEVYASDTLLSADEQSGLLSLIGEQIETLPQGLQGPLWPQWAGQSIAVSTRQDPQSAFLAIDSIIAKLISASMPVERMRILTDDIRRRIESLPEHLKLASLEHWAELALKAYVDNRPSDQAGPVLGQLLDELHKSLTTPSLLPLVADRVAALPQHDQPGLWARWEQQVLNSHHRYSSHPIPAIYRSVTECIIRLLGQYPSLPPEIRENLYNRLEQRISTRPQTEKMPLLNYLSRQRR